MSTIKSKKVQLGTDANAANNFTLYQPATPDGTLRIGVGNADSPTEVGRFNNNGYVATNAPAFRAKIVSTTSMSNATWNKITFDNEQYDTANCYASSRFTPNVAGYYLLSCAHGGLASLGTNAPLAIFKNGGWDGGGVNVNGYGSTSNVFYANGTTDYFEVYQYQNSGGSVTNNTGAANFFAGVLVRAE